MVPRATLRNVIDYETGELNLQHITSPLQGIVLVTEQREFCLHQN